MSMQQIGIIVLVAALAALIYVEVQKRSTFAKIEHYMEEQDFASVLALLDRPITRVLYPAYNRLFMRLNACLAMGDTEATVRVIEEMLPLRMTKQQELALAIKAFSFYVEIEDKDGAGKMLERIEAHGSKEMAQMSRQTYEIFLCGSTAYIDEMEAALADAPLPEQARLCQLLALQYESRGDQPRADEYHARAKKAFERALKQ